MNLTPEQKGKLFEDWVKLHLFKSDYFILEELTHPYEAGKERRIESMKNPDFKFKCKKSGREFWVEAKYRSHFKNEKIEWAKPDQMLRYRDMNSDEVPVFIVIGYEGTPDNPAYVSFFHINELKYSALFNSTLKEFDTHKIPFTEDVILNRIPTVKTKPNTIRAETKAKPRNKYKWVIVAALIIVAVIFYNSSSLKSTDIESPDAIALNRDRDKICSYYANSQQNKLNVDAYFAPAVSRFITRTNLTSEDVKKCMATDKNEFKNEEFKLSRDEILLDRTENGIRYYRFWMHYKCYRVSLRKNEDCDVNVEIGFDQSNKFVSYKEVKIENLKFY
ncbi:MAG TPA: hypothetical protein VK808_00175 [Bacteroidia bacterium]|jgi:hypothetical protein|nr:hypothetical protein [Bacteroidia bacterium]